MATRNTLNDLNNHLFAQLERLSDETIKGDDLKEEFDRSKAVTEVAKNIINNAALALQAEKFVDDRMDASRSMPVMLEQSNE